LFALISFIKLIVSGDRFGLLVRALDVCFQNTRKSSRCKPQERLWLDKEECLFPEATHPGQEHKKKPICLPAGRAFALSAQNDELLS
jgi:hypothetical protein